MRLQRCIWVFWAVAFLIPPSFAAAQSSTTGAIAGSVEDTTELVLPGVTVEASSPALIGGVRTAVTDGRGNYKIIDLRPGVYTVTFTLQGFSTYRREGVELTTGITATVNGEMTVGAVEETITVSGVAPVVDIQNVRSQTVLSEDTLDSLPFARSVASLAQLTLGVTMGSASEMDVGGVKEAGNQMIIHGSRGSDGRFLVDGISFQNNSGDGGGRMKTYFANQIAMQETAIETGGMSAEADTGGVRVNYVPKEGGNQFSFYGTANFANGDMQTENVTDEHLARGVSTSSKLDRMYDAGVGVGGPIIQDKLWFFGSFRGWGSREFQPGVFFNKSTSLLFYERDESRPGFIDNYYKDTTIRVTWQAAEKHKIAFHESLQNNCYCFSRVRSSLSPEATYSLRYNPMHLASVSWSNPVSNKLLIDAALGYHYQPKKNVNLSISPDAVAITDVGLGITYGAFASTSSVAYNTTERGQLDDQFNGRVSLSYVTGSHAAKVGFTFFRGWQRIDRTTQNHISYTFRDRVPISLRQWATPILTTNEIFKGGIYAQDQWTIDRVTLSGGLRFDWMRGWAESVDLAASLFRPAATFPAIEDSPSWRDLSPRMGVAYDLIGNGRTAVKASVGRFAQSMGAGLTERINPQLSISPRADRSWNDANLNYVPDCDLTTPVANGECGALNNRRFGTVVLTRTYDEDYINGFGVRPYNWQTSVLVQHELRRNVGLEVGYFRTWYGNFAVTDNLAVGPEDYDPYCVTLPTDPLLPGSGQKQCGLFDINPAKFGQVDNFVTLGDSFGNFSNVYNGLDAKVTARFDNGALLNGGISVGRTVENNCVVIDSPQAARPEYCEVVTPWWGGGGQVKISSVYYLPWGVRVSGTFQNVAVGEVLANRRYVSSEVAGSLGRNLSAGNARVAILPDGTLYEDRLTQVDLRLTKIFEIGGGRVEASLDLYNLTNSGAILDVNDSYGSRWRQPTVVIPPRLVKVGAVVEF